MYKITSAILLSLFLGTLTSCNIQRNHDQIITSIEKEDTCSSDKNNTYEIYIPERKSTDKVLPLLIILDSHGSGKFALNKFKSGADKYSIVLTASNYVKNGFEGYDNAIQTIIEDVRQKYPVGQTTFITGFSGGARMALSYAQAHPIDGLILCGALANALQINALHCPVISISGMDDFNFIETAQYIFQKQQMPANLKIELTNASHSWPDSVMLTNELGYLCLSVKSKELPLISRLQIAEYTELQQSRIDTLQKQGDFLKATLIARNMASSEGLDKNKTFAAIYNSLKTSKEYTDELERLAQTMNYELNIRQTYIDAFTTKNLTWWSNEIKNVNNKINQEQDVYNKDMYLRIKGFWGIACYSLCKQAIIQNNAEMLNKILSVYRITEPENPDMFYFSSFIPFWKGDNSETLLSLQQALKAGYSDIQQLRHDFPESITSQLNNL
ncbi:MAG: hypothetical protein PHH37_03490 [Paludibacter sp.]|nr:hypothetical protein [Paludibacter sp.]